MAVDPAKVYHGKPCRRCGKTLRRKCNRNCVTCDIERKRRKNRVANMTSDQIERKREWDRKYRNSPKGYANKFRSDLSRRKSRLFAAVARHEELKAAILQEASQ